MSDKENYLTFSSLKFKEFKIDLSKMKKIDSPVNDEFNKFFEDNLPELERKLGACPKHLEDIIVRAS